MIKEDIVLSVCDCCGKRNVLVLPDHAGTICFSCLAEQIRNNPAQETEEEEDYDELYNDFEEADYNDDEALDFINSK